MADLGAILGDLAAETRTIDDVVADLPAADWARATPAEGWTIAHQIAHLAWTDGQALIAAAHPERWQAEIEHMLAVGPRHIDEAAAEGARKPPEKLLEDWREGRDELAKALEAVPDGQKLPWYGPPMSAASMATARMLETWAHGQDISDALGLPRSPPNHRRPAGRPDRRLSRRADDADLGPRPDEGSEPRLRQDVPAPDGGEPRAGEGKGRQDRRQRRWAQPGRTGRRPP